LLAKGKAQCYAFGSPPVFEPVEKPLPTHVTAAMHCFINGMDCVPRLCGSTLGKLLMAVKEVDELDLGLAERQKFLSVRDSILARLPDFMEIPEEIRTEFAKLSQVGTTLVLFRRGDGKMECKKLDHSSFDRMLIHENMFKHHSTTSYDESLNEAVMQYKVSNSCC